MRRSRRTWVVGAALFMLFFGAFAGLIALQGELCPRWNGVAFAEDVMKFEPVPAESVTAMERRRAERRARDAERRAEELRKALPAPPDAPEPPDVPEPPEPPEPPDADFSHAGDVVRIGSDIHIEKGQTVEGDVFALRGDIEVDGHVKGNVAATGGNVILGSTARVDGDVMCIGGKLEEASGARVGGQRVTALRGSGTRITRIHRRLGDHDFEDSGFKLFPDRDVKHLTFAISWLLLMLAVAWGVGKFAPNRSQVALDTLRQEPGLTLGIGLGTILMLVPSVVALALVVAILCITIIGIPLALGALVAYAGLLVVLAIWGYVVGVMPIGQRAVQRLGRPVNPVMIAVFGVLLVSGLKVISEMLRFVPFFGWFGKLLWVVAFMIACVATLMGAGALLRTKFGQGRDARWWPLFTIRRPGVTPESAPPPTEPPPPPPSPAEPSPAA